MNNNWYELPEMSAGQAQDFMDGIRAFNENVAVSSINNGCNINEEMRAIEDYNRRVEHNLPLRPDRKYFVGALDESGRHYRFTKE